MQQLDRPAYNFVLTCYITAEFAFVGSLIYIIWSKQHRITRTIAIIYLLEILCLSCAIATFFESIHQKKQNALFSISFSAHWIAIGFFTGEYVKVATQVPLLRKTTVLRWLPMLLNLLIWGTLGIAIYGLFFWDAQNVYVKWILFTLRTFLAFSLLIVQVV